MSLRRVLVATALVAVLASSLFSGWLGSSLSVLVPHASAQTIPDCTDAVLAKTIISGSDFRAEGGNIKFRIKTAASGFDCVDTFTKKTNGIATALVESGQKSNADFFATYTSNFLPSEALTSNGKSFRVYFLVSDSTNRPGFTEGIFFHDGTKYIEKDAFDIQWLSGLSSTDRANYNKYANYLKQIHDKYGEDNGVKVLGYEVGGGSPGSTAYGQATVQEWFNNEDIPDLEVTIYETANTPPKLLVPKSKLGNRPPEDLSFKLVAHSGEGALFIGNKDWMTFQGYLGSTKIDNLYFQLSDDLDTNFYYETDFNELIKGHDTPTGTEIGRAKAEEGDKLSNSIGKLFTYIMNVPINENGTVGGQNCGNGATAKLIKVTGPVGKGLTPPPNINRTTEAGVDGKAARDLNQNCLNDSANASNGGQANGWLAYWGVKNVFSSNPGGGCFNIGDLLKKGIGPAIITIFACVIQSIIDGIFTPLTELTQGAGEQTGVLECNLAGETNAQIPVSCQEAGRDGPPNPSFYRAWKFSLGLINVIVILALLAIAFANILHLNLNTYAAKKALPGLVIGVVGANASLLLIRFVLDVAKALQLFAFDIAGVATTGEFVKAFMEKIGMTAFQNSIINGALVLLGPITLIVMLIFAIYMFYLVFVFAWGMIKRLVYIYGLTVLAPLAFVSYGIPGQQQWFTKWWDMMLRQIFMLPVVFLGAAMLIKYVKIGFDPSKINATGALDVSNLINMLLVFLTATAILKLPGLITKGAVDITGAAKKAFGMAKVAPQNLMMRTSGLTDKLAAHGGKGKGFSNRLAKYTGVGIKGLAKSATFAGNPEIMKAAWEDRMKQNSTNRKVDFNSTKMEDLRINPAYWLGQGYGKKWGGLYRGGTGLRGAFSGLQSEVDQGIEDVDDYIPRDADAKTVMELAMHESDGKNRPALERLIEALDKADDPAKKAILLRQLGKRATKPLLQKTARELIRKGGIPGHDSAWRIHGTVRNIMDEVTKEFNRVYRNTDLTTKEKNEEIARLTEDAIRNNGDYTIAEPPKERIRKQFRRRNDYDDEEDDGAAFGTAGKNRPPDDPPPGSGGGGSIPGGKIMKVFVTNPVEIQNPQNDALFNKLSEHVQSLMDTVGSDNLIAHANNAGGDLGKLLSGPVGEEIKGQIGHLMNEGGGKLIHELVSAAASGGNVDGLKALVARGEIIDRTGQEMVGEAAQFSDEQMNRLAETVGKSVGEGVQSISGVLAPHFQKLGITDPKVIAAYGQKVIDGLQSSINKGPNNLRDEMVNQFGKLAKTVAQEQGLDHIDNMSLASSIAQAESRQPAPPPAAQTNTTNVTNVSNVEQTTPVKPASSAQADISSTPTEPEPPTTGP